MSFPAASKINVEDLAELYESIPEDVEAELRKLGISGEIPQPDCPEGLGDFLLWAENGDPVCPTDLTVAESAQLGQLFSFFTGWANYVACEETEIRVFILVTDEVVKIIKSVLIISYREEGKPATLAADYVQADMRWAQPNRALTLAKATKLKVSTRYDQMRRTLKLISREQTRRGEVYESHAHDASGGDGWRRKGEGGKIDKARFKRRK